MQAEALFLKRFGVILSSTLLLVSLAACKGTASGDVVASVNGKSITRSELDKAYNDYKATQGTGPEDPVPTQTDIVRLNLLEHMIEDEILQQQAVKLNLVASDDEVNAKLTEMKALSTEEEFQKMLKSRNETLEDVKRDIRRNLTATKLLNKEVESKINITDADISNYYNAHKSQFNVIEPQYHLARIVVTTGSTQQPVNLQNNKATSDADARKKIQTVRSRLTTGEDFQTLAMNFSEDPNTNSSGGDMGFIAESALQQSDPAAFAAISKLKIGQVTDVLPIYAGAGPAQRAIGYAIYKVLGREPAGQRELNNPSVQQTIRQGLRETRAQLLKQAYFEMLRDNAKIQNNFAEQILKEGAK